MAMQTAVIPLFGEVMVGRPETISMPTGMDKMAIWAEAFETWMSGLRCENTQRAYRKGWSDLMEFTQKQPWAIGKKDMQEWSADMRARGLSACTIQQRLASVSAFFTFVSEDYTIVRADGREVPLHDINPAAGKSLRPKISPYGKAIYLSTEQTRALLKAIKRTTVQGLRDYALYLGYIFTARRNSELRELHWGDIWENDGRAFYTWSGKGKKDQRYELPGPVWVAIKGYLKAAGRLEGMKAEDYIFTALTNRATRLPNVDVQTFDPTAQPLSMREVGRLLKHYCRLAGLDRDKVHVHTLRHTGAMLRKAAGDDVEKICALLGHSSLAVTQIYLDHVEEKKDDSWAKVETLLGL